MKRVFNKKTLSIVLVLTLVAGIFVGQTKVLGTKSSAKSAKDVAKEALLAKRAEVLSNNLKMNTAASDNEVVRAIIKLEAKSVADTNNVSEYNSKLKSKEEKIISKQESLVEKVEKITGNEVVNQTAYLVNSFSIDATRAQMKKIAKLDGVDTVYEASTYKTNMATAVDEGNVRSVWNTEEYGYTGEGVVVSIIDTGVNYKHQDMVLDSGVKNKYTKEQWKEKIELLGYGKYFTEKVPFGYDYSENKTDCLSTHKNHGYHVAGIVSSNGEIVGVAKNAQVLGMKVFSDKGQGANTDDIVKAIEDSVKLGADIINMSLGYDKAVISDEDFSQLAVANATKDGVLCCIAAGNSGTSSSTMGDNTNVIDMIDTTTLGTPAVAKSALTVASADNIFKATMSEMTAQIGDTEEKFDYFDFVGNGFDVSELEMVDVGIGVDADRKITFDEKSVKDKLAIVMRGVSTFNDKMFRISKAGAKAIILVDYTDVISTNIACNDWYGVPVIVVGKTTGDMLLLAKDAGKTFSTVSTKLKEELLDVRMSSFSSWGTTNELDIKPEITAPGGNITAPTIGEDVYETLSGTSMATPFVAGSQALMLNAIRDRGLDIKGEELVDFMKNSLMNTADMIIDPDTNLPYSVRYQGAGMVDVYGAVDNNVIATVLDEAKAELREVKDGQTFDIKLTNYGNEVAKYSLKDTALYADYTFNNPQNEEYQYGIKPVSGAKITYDASEIVVEPGKTVEVKATVHIPSTYEADRYVEGFIVFEGKDVQNIGMPVLGFNGDYTKETIIDAPIYEIENAYFNGVNNLVGLSSSTGLVGYGDGELDDYLGREYVSYDANSEELNNILSDKTLSAAEKKDIARVIGTTALVEESLPNKKDAVSVKVGDSAELAIINAGDYGLYKLSSNENTGVKIYADGSLQPYVLVYDKNMNFVTGTIISSSLAGDRPFEFSMKQGKKYYVQVFPTQAQTGLSTVRFDSASYYENEDISIYETEKKQVKINYLKVGRTTNAANNGENEHSFVFECKKDGAYTFTIDTESFVEYKLYEFKKNRSGKMTYVDTVAEGTEFSKAEITAKLNSKSKYALDLIGDSNYIEGENFASVSVSKADLSNVKNIGTRFDGSKNAFSPNEDGVRDGVVPYITQLRNAHEVSVKVLDENKKVIRTIARCIDTSKLTLADIAAGYGATELANYALGEIVNWDGKLYNKETKKYEIAPEGQYYIRLESKLRKNALPQEVTMPVKVDTTAPKINNYAVVEKENNTVLTFDVSDDQGVSPYYYVYIQQKAKEGAYAQPMEGALGKIYAQTEVNEQGKYELNLGTVNNADVYLLVEDNAGNMAMETVIVDDSTIMFKDEYFGEELSESYLDGKEYIKTSVPSIELVKNNNMSKVANYNLQNVSLVLLEKDAAKDFTFQVKATDMDSNVDQLQVMYMSGETGNYGMAINNGNGLYSINTQLISRMSSFAIFVSDAQGNMNYIEVVLYDNSKEEEFKLDCTELDFVMEANLETTIITKDMLNADGTFTVKGVLGAMPDKLTINEEEVVVDPKNKNFEYNVKVNGGKTRINILVEKDGIKSETSAELYYNDLIVDFDETIKVNEDGVITVKKDIFNLKGIITTYVNVGSMTINGDSVFVSGESITASFEKPMIRNFDFEVELEEGLNNIVFEIVDLSGQKVVKELKINYVK